VQLLKSKKHIDKVSVREYPPRVPRNKEIVTTKKVTITVFLAAYQNSPSIQASLYAFKV
jgi:hypothetical protein